MGFMEFMELDTLQHPANVHAPSKWVWCIGWRAKLGLPRFRKLSFAEIQVSILLAL